MKDKTGREIKVGDRVKDNVGREGEFVDISGTKAVKFEHEGKINYAFPHKMIESEIEVVV